MGHARDRRLGDGLRPGWAPGFGPAWTKTPARDVTEDHPIQLVRDDVPINGRLVDLEGRPVSGASIRVDSLWTPESRESIDRWLRDAYAGTRWRRAAAVPLFPDPREVPGQ